MKLPSEMKKPRTWRTRADPFAADWPEIESMLKQAPGLEAQAIFEHLLARKPGAYQEGQVRTLQRRIKVWRALHGPGKEVFFPQNHRPGEALQTDFTWATELEVTLQGVPFPHMLCHSVLPYSNWEWATICQTESMLALRRSVPAVIAQLGHVPQFHQTDNSSSATHDLANGKRDFNEDYIQLMKHLGMTPRTIGIGKSEQNGDVESGNGHLKRRLNQHLLLRGSRDFTSEDAWEAFVQKVCRATNARRKDKLTEELAQMRPFTGAPFKEFDELNPKVNGHSTILIKRNHYSVPSRLIGERVQVRVHEMRIEVWYGDSLILQAPRLIGSHHHRIDYRHVIESLMRKPGAFERYRYRDCLFPGLVWRQAYDALQNALGDRKGEVEYLRPLHLAAGTMECEVQTALEVALATGRLPDADLVKGLMGAGKPVDVPEMPAPAVDLGEYDALNPEMLSEAM
jgi:hypothetical protein